MLTIPKTQAYTEFRAGNYLAFKTVLTSQERKIVLRDTPIETFTAIRDFAETLTRSPDTLIAFPAISVAQHAHTLAHYLSSSTGLDRLFRHNGKVAMDDAGIENNIPSMDNSLSLLSLNLVSLSKRLSVTPLHDVLAAIPPLPPKDYRPNYEKVFGKLA